MIDLIEKTRRQFASRRPLPHALLKSRRSRRMDDQTQRQVKAIDLGKILLAESRVCPECLGGLDEALPLHLNTGQPQHPRQMTRIELDQPSITRLRLLEPSLALGDFRS